MNTEAADCIFCKIVSKKIPSKIVLDEKDILAFHDVNPKAPVHLLVITKQHVAKIDDMTDAQGELLGKMIYAAKKLAEEYNIKQGYRLVFNNGLEAGQSVFHIHLHLLGGRPMSWPPG